LSLEFWRKLYRFSGLAVAILVPIAYVVGFILGRRSVALLITLPALLFAVLMAVCVLIEALQKRRKKKEETVERLGREWEADREQEKLRAIGMTFKKIQEEEEE